MRRPKYRDEGDDTANEDDVPLYGANSTNRRFIGQTGDVEARNQPSAGFVVGPDAGGRPSYQFRTAPGAPLAETPDLFTSGAGRFARTFGANSPLGVAAGVAPANSWSAAQAAQGVSSAQTDQISQELKTTPPSPDELIEQSIALGEAYNKQHNLPSPAVRAALGKQGRDQSGNYLAPRPFDPLTPAEGSERVKPFVDRGNYPFWYNQKISTEETLNPLRTPLSRFRKIEGESPFPFPLES